MIFFKKYGESFMKKDISTMANHLAHGFFVLIRHLLIDEYRSLGRRARDRENQLFDDSAMTFQDKDLIEDLLLNLPQDARELVQKYYLEEMSYEELESASGLSQANLRQRLSRAIRGLRKSYEK